MNYRDILKSVDEIMADMPNPDIIKAQRMLDQGYRRMMDAALYSGAYAGKTIDGEYKVIEDAPQIDGPKP